MRFVVTWTTRYLMWKIDDDNNNDNWTLKTTLLCKFDKNINGKREKYIENEICITKLKINKATGWLANFSKATR